MSTLLRVVWARLCGFFQTRALDRDFEEELASHLAMAEEDLVSRGMSRREARRRARVELGGVTQLREATREARGLPWIDTFWLDIKLSFRMLRKSWGLTLVGGLAMTIAITVGVVIFWILETSLWSTLPLDEGNRVVAIQTWDEKARAAHGTTWMDVEHWRDGLRTLEEIGAFRTVQRNLVIEGGSVAPVLIAEMTASGFDLARVAPLLGRPLTEEDEVDGAPVAVIGYDLWQTRFSGALDVVGKTMRLGDTVNTVVGVMPQEFAFPVNHQMWTPLPMDRPQLSLDPEKGMVFARLAPGVRLERARGEVASLGMVQTSAPKDPDRELRPRVVPYPLAFSGDIEQGEASWIVRLILMLITLLLIPPCANIAILVYARTITRQEEFAARFTLGASRGRIVGQLFIEVLVLAACAAVAALFLASLGGMYMEKVILEHESGGVPFWVDFSPTLRMVLVASGLALVAALIAGLVPALKATGRQVQSGFSSLGSRTNMRLGKTWTALVVTQVALTLAALPSAVEMGWGTIREGILGPGFAAEEYLTARLTVDPEGLTSTADHDPQAFASRFGNLKTSLIEQLRAEPGVLGVTSSRTVPGDEPWAIVEVDGIELVKEGILDSRDVVQYNHVDDAFFDVFEIQLLMGRGFKAQDFEAAQTPLIVNQTFARRLLGEGTNPLGHRVRYTRRIEGQALTDAESETWCEIVGVVADRPAHATHGTMYHPMQPGQVYPASLALHTGLTPFLLADRLRNLAMALDPNLRLEEIVALDEIYYDQQIGNNMGAFSLAMVTLSVLLLSAAGMYALMSFTVNQRRREIGIRAALGAQPKRLVVNILERALSQVAVGAAIGALVAFLLDLYLPVEQVGGWNVPGVIPAAVVLMLMIGLLAAAGPTRRGLQVDPIKVLRED